MSARLLTPRLHSFRTVLTTARVRTFTSKTFAHENQPGRGQSAGRQRQITPIFLSEGWMSKAGPGHYLDCPMTIALLRRQWCELSPPALPGAPASLQQRPPQATPRPARLAPSPGCELPVVRIPEPGPAGLCGIPDTTANSRRCVLCTGWAKARETELS